MIFKKQKSKNSYGCISNFNNIWGSISSSYAAELTNAQSAVVASQQRIDLDTTFKKIIQMKHLLQIVTYKTAT